MDEFDQLLEKACETPAGRIKASFIVDDLAKLAPVYADETKRSFALAALQAWEHGPDTMRKSMAAAWLAQARAKLAPIGRAALASAKNSSPSRAAKAINDKVGDLGAAAGEKLARSPLNAKRMNAVRAEGSRGAQDRMAARLTRNPNAPPPSAGTTAARGEAMESAGRIGADNASNAHAGAIARHGRVAAKHAFRAGLAIGGGGAAAAGLGIHSRLSDKQHKQRVDAARSQSRTQRMRTTGV